MTASITADGPPVTLTTTTPGQNALLTFSGSAGQRVSLKVENSTYGVGNGAVYIYNPDGTTLGSDTSVNTGDFIDTRTLPATGTYTIFVNPKNAAVGGLTLTLHDVPADFTGSVVIGGAAVPVNLSVPGQNGRLTFDGAAGQQVTVRVTGNTMGTVTVKLLDTGGAALATTTTSGANFNLPARTLSAAGTYTVSVDPSGPNTGTLNVSVTSP